MATCEEITRSRGHEETKEGGRHTWQQFIGSFGVQVLRQQGPGVRRHTELGLWGPWTPQNGLSGPVQRLSMGMRRLEFYLLRRP